MGDTGPLLAGGVATITICWNRYDASCNPIDYRFNGTTEEGLSFTGIGETGGGKGGRKRRGGTTGDGGLTVKSVKLRVNEIEVTDPATGVIVVDDGGFSIDCEVTPWF